jgi:hypothetical protein
MPTDFLFYRTYSRIGNNYNRQLFCMNFKGISLYIDPASFLILLFPTMLLIKSQFSWAEIGEAFTLAFRKRPVNKSKLEKALLFFTALQKMNNNFP